jgi:hypothetical protein
MPKIPTPTAVFGSAFMGLGVVVETMADETDDSVTDSDDSEEEQDVNQYGGGDQDIDAVKQTERREDDVETGEGDVGTERKDEDESSE